MKKIIFFSLAILLIYTRVVGLHWGLPYPMHPDERNMAWALTRLSPANLFRPDFFAYGQLPLYLGYLLVFLRKLLVGGKGGAGISFIDAVLSLRIIAVLASLTAFVYLKKILDLFKITNPLFLLVFIFFPAFIQFSHFGTTESLLMAYGVILVYYSVRILRRKLTDKMETNYIRFFSLFIGLAIATKVSSLIFLAIPLLVLLLSPTKKRWAKEMYSLVLIVLGSLVVAIIFSPYNFLSFDKFVSSIRYESAVATGTIVVFYTRQFSHSLSFLFQFIKIFPFSVGWGGLSLFAIGFFTRLRDRRVNFLRLTWLTLFLSSGLLFAKWARFMAPVFPLMAIFCVLGLDYVWRKTKSRFLLAAFLLAAILPGIAYLPIYQTPDVRFQASNWIYRHIPAGARILSETANVVDIPLSTEEKPVDWPEYRVTSFNFYDLDSNFKLTKELADQVRTADYIIVPSRRIFANHTCYQSDKSGRVRQVAYKWGYDRDVCAWYRKQYPRLNRYYDGLFSGRLGFVKVAQLSSFPRLNIFGLSLQFADEGAEESWTVFDHPVIRIYKKMTGVISNFQFSNPNFH